MRGTRVFFQLCKKTVQGFHGESFLIFVEQGIIGRQVRIVISGKFLIISDDFFQIRRKGLEIVFIFCLFPDGLGVVDQHVVRHIFLWGNSGYLAVGFPEERDLPAGNGVQILDVLFQIR